MAENKEYVSRETDGGSINISEDVIATIASAATSETEGVAGFATSLGKEITDLLGVKKNAPRGTKIEIVDGTVKVDTFILVKYGALVTDTAKAVQDGVKNSIEAMTGLSVVSVNVHVCGISFDKQQ